MKNSNLIKTNRSRYTWKIFKPLLPIIFLALLYIFYPFYNNSKSIKYIFKKSQESGYIQDVEILLLLLKKKILVEELPVTWSHKAGSKVNIFLDSVLMFFDLIKLKFKFIYR